MDATDNAGRNSKRNRRVDQGTQDERTVLVVPREMRTDLLKLAHDDPSSGHMGINRCVERLQQKYYWPGMTSEVQLWVAECEQCNRRKTPAVTTRADEKQRSRKINGTVGNGYPRKWVEAVPLPNQRAETVARAFVDEVIARHGVPTKLITDQGRNFEADLVKVFEILGVKKLRTSPYHPQTDGQVERLNRTLEWILTIYVNQDHNDWDIHLPLALFAYQNSVHASSGVSPLRAVYGREATTPLILLSSTTETKKQLISNYSDELENTPKDVHNIISRRISLAQQKQEKNYDQQHKTDKCTELKEGDRVESGKGKMVHRNRLKLDKKQSRGNCIERSEEKQPDATTYEPEVLHQEIPAGLSPIVQNMPPVITYQLHQHRLHPAAVICHNTFEIGLACIISSDSSCPTINLILLFRIKNGKPS
ncbi:Retrovirus-related Pol poly from transposon [Paramuricea clavata]|uniref:Retrovirus-related Pol poly from transposon n=1 Tax=Paramuricea clavata TaxID=317549 RepID=A0A6S7FWJ0_PARCT|nr:Retrovirus-related Pol poly from transposon [Paramuricea clavata]